MSRINRRTLAASALAILFGLALHAAAQSPQPIEARRQIALGLYRTAELTAKQALRRPPGEAMPADVHREWLVLLTEVYYRSRQYDQALDRLREAGQALERQRRLHPEYGYVQTRPRLQMALWQARIELARAAAAGTPPASGLVNDDIPAEGLSPSDQADRLELLVLRAQLGDLREQHASPPDRQRRWSLLRQQADSLFHQTQAGAESAGPYASILLSLARCCEGEGKPRQAAEILRAVAIPPPGAIVSPRVKDLRAETARILRRAKLFREEALFWQDVLDTEGLRKADQGMVEIERLNTVAGIHFDRAETLHLAGAAADIVKQELDESERCYRQAIELNPGLAANLQQEAELRAIMTVSRQGLLRIRLTPEEWNKTIECSFDEKDVTRTVALLRLLKAMRIDSDPLVHHLEATLGAQYLRMGDNIPKARECLVAANAFFEAYRFAPPATQIQLLVLLAEIDRYEGCYDAAKSKLEKAADRYDKAGLQNETLRLWIEVHRGRLAAIRGRFSEAEARYSRVVRGAEAAGREAADAGSMARLGLAMLYKGFGRLDKAETMCRDALATRTASSPAAMDDQALIPYQIALAGILILEGNLNGAETVVDAARRLLKNDVDGGSSQSCELLHLTAMLAFLRYKSRPCEDLAAEVISGAAEKSWLKVLAVQKEKVDRLGEARTCLYLSQLHFFRWQRQALCKAKHDLKGFDRDFTEYSRRRDALKAAEATYKEDYDNWKTKTVGEQRESFRELDKRWEDLKEQRDKLTETAGSLRHMKKEVLETYDLLVNEMFPNAARPAARGLPSAASTRVEPTQSEPPEIKTADVLAGRAADILEKSPLYPNLQYITLCHRASVLRARAKWDRKQADKALDCLERSVTLLEHPRLSLFEGDVARAEFLSQYTQAFDQLIEWHCLCDEPLEALVYAELCRNRTLLDWIRSNGDDGRRQAAEPLYHDAEEAFRDSTRLARALHDMDAAAAKSGRPPDPGTRTKMLEEFNGANEQYEKRRKEIQEKALSGQVGFGEVLDRDHVRKVLRERILRKKELAIYYHVGSSNSYLFVLGLDCGPRVIRLQSDELRADLTQHVSAERVRTWVTQYLDQFSKAGAFPGASTSKRSHLARITDRVLPPGVRRELAEKMQRDQLPLIVSPAGPLQHIPFDALLVQDGGRQSFLIDRLPPTGITYTPSLMILRALERAEPPLAVPSVVTVACCDFSGRRTTRGASATASLPNLPLATKESDAVAGFFAEGAHRLRGVEATKDRFRREIDETKPAYVHLATHSVALSLAPALVLHPGVDAAGVRDDGCLTIGEICTLPLAECRLAMLSACRTNTGPELPGEMAMSISRAFLMAKARRVVASQWPVEDRAACDHVRSLLAELASQWKSGESCNYAAAMIAARNKLRSERADDPFYWAPFILIGPARDVTQ